MNPVRIMGRQTPKISEWMGIPGGGTDLDQATCSAFCAGMPDEWYMMARLKWADDYTVVPRLKIALWGELGTIARSEKWKKHNDTENPYHRRIANLVIDEIIDPSRFISPKHKYTYIQVSKTQWHEVWYDRYIVAWELAQEWSNKAFRYIHSRQKEE